MSPETSPSGRTTVVEPRSGGPRFGEILIQRGLATREEIVAALRVQGSRAAAGTLQNLGEILVEQGVLSAEQVSGLMAEQHKVIMACPACRERYNVLRAAAQAASCPADGAPLAPAEAAEGVGVAATLRGETGSLIGRELGRCRIVELLGRGAMGAVYKARHTGLNRYVAVKTLSTVSKDPTHVRRLLFEARTIARLEHPNIVQVYDVGFQDGHFFMVMKLVPGRSLEERLAEWGAPTLDQSVALVRDVARGLEAAHREGIVHRDLKPANIMVAEDGQACLADFGLAQAGGLPDELDGMLVGTPCYMAPELWLGKKVDARTDLYSLGILFYQLATGRKPFEGRTAADLMKLHTEGRARAPRAINPELPAGIQAVIGRLMARSPERRYPSAPAFLADLDRALRNEGPEALGESDRKRKCGFCETLNPAGAERCEVCKERLDAPSGGDLDLALRPGEFACGGCGTPNAEGGRVCAGCRKAFCERCGARPAEVGTFCWTCRGKGR